MIKIVAKAQNNIPGFKIELARSIRMHMKEANITQNELAEMVGVSQPYISRISSLKLKGISMDKLIFILMCLNIKVDIKIGKQDDGFLYDVTHESFPE